jgi:transposase
MRRLLVQAAHASLHCRRDSALKRWALQLATRVGKRKAVVALARKIAVLLHHLWATGSSYQALPKAA